MIEETQTLAPPARGGTYPELAPGTVVDGAFRVIRQLGKGGMGAVYQVEEIDLKRKCALKVLALPPDTDGVLASRFMREAQLMAGLRHPGVVPVMRYGVDEKSGLPYYTMPDYVLSSDRIARICRDSFGCEPPLFRDSDETSTRSLTLSNILDGYRTLPEAVVARIGLELLEALQAMHSRQPPIIHRDIKPSNLLIDAAGNILLADFGIARVVASGIDGHTLTTGVIPGTPQYSSPEQRAGASSEFTCASDYYSFGLVLFRALTGGMPSPDFPDLPAQARERLSPRWDTLLQGLLEQSPVRRLTDPDRIGSLLREIMRTVAGGKRAGRGAGRLRRFVHLAAIVLLSAAGAAIGYHIFRGSNAEKTAVVDARINDASISTPPATDAGYSDIQLAPIPIPSTSEPVTVWLGDPPAPTATGAERNVIISNAGLVVTTQQGVPATPPAMTVTVGSAIVVEEAVQVESDVAPLEELTVRKETVTPAIEVTSPPIATAIRALDSSIACVAEALDKVGKLPEPVKNQSGEVVFIIAAGEAVSLLDCDFPPNARLILDGGTLLFAPPERDMKRYLDELRGHRQLLLSGAISATTDEPEVPPAADQDMHVRVPIEIGRRGGVFEDVFEMNRIHLQEPVTAGKGVTRPLLKLDSGLCHFTFASLPTGLRIDGSYRVFETTEDANGRTVRRVRYYGDNYPGEITVH